MAENKIDPENVSFEDNLKELKSVVDSLEGGEFSLKESLEKFERGINLINRCHKELESVELKVETIVKKDDKVEQSAESN